jgi:N-sulfoglucosamine sulfohydrolase
MKKYFVSKRIKSETCNPAKPFLINCAKCIRAIRKKIWNLLMSARSGPHVSVEWYPSLLVTAVLCLLLVVSLSGMSWAETWQDVAEAKSRPNVLIITADDMTYNSLGIMGNPMENITPNIDRLAKQGMLFTRGYVTTPVCGPSRESIFTGLYPVHHGVMGHGDQLPAWWKPPQEELTGLFKWLGRHGYYTGVIDKHVSRYDGDGVDYTKGPAVTGLGRDPAKYFALTREFLEQANRAGKPFVLNVNAADPHRPFAGERYETEGWIKAMLEIVGAKKEQLNEYPNGKPWPDPEQSYSPEEVVVPAPYPDTPAFREWLTHYYASVNRLDEVVGRTLDALGEERANNTIVLFLSDHGLAFSFSKWSLYPHGTRTPIIVRWPGRVEPGRLDATHLLSTVDIMPTLLDALDVPVPYELDGISFLPLIMDKNADWVREKIFTTWNFMDRGQHADPVYSVYQKDLYKKARQYRPMRALHGQRYVYVWNGWADGETEISMVMGGKGSPAISILSNMQDAGPFYPDPAKRAEFYLFRIPEELYDVERDPGCLNNLAGDPAYRPVLKSFRLDMLATMDTHRDHELDNYRSYLADTPVSPGAEGN